MKRQVVVVGLGHFGTAVARTLHQLGHEVLAVDIDARRVQAVRDDVTHAVQADATDREAMQELGVSDFDTAVVATSSDLSASILATLTLRDLGCRYIIAKAGDSTHARILERLGASRVVLPEEESGVHVAHSVAARAVQDYMDLGPGYGIAIVRPPAALMGKTLSELEPGRTWHLSLIALLRGPEVFLNPRVDMRLQAGDLLVLAGRDDDLARVPI